MGEGAKKFGAMCSSNNSFINVTGSTIIGSDVLLLGGFGALVVGGGGGSVIGAVAGAVIVTFSNGGGIAFGAAFDG